MRELLRWRLRGWARVGLSVVLASVSGQSLSEESGPILSPPTIQQIFEKFLDENKTCTDFTDGCSICMRLGNTYTCSMPAIACILRELRCTRYDRTLEHGSKR